MSSSLLAIKCLLPLILGLTLALFMKRFKDIFRDRNMNKWMKILHLGYFISFSIFILFEILNSFEIMNDNCFVWYSCSMSFFWFARFLFSLELVYILFLSLFYKYEYRYFEMLKLLSYTDLIYFSKRVFCRF